MRRIPLTERLARFSARRPWLTIAAWLVIVVAAGGLLVAFGDSLQAADDFIGHPESKQAQELLAERIPGSDADTEIVVVRSASLTVDEPAYAARVRDLASAIRALAPQDVRDGGDLVRRAGRRRTPRRPRPAPRRPRRARAPRPSRPPRRPPSRRPARRRPSSPQTVGRPSCRSRWPCRRARWTST